MRKIAFYPRLALGNLWRNKKTYLPYLLACVVSIFTFYTLLAISVGGTLDGIRQEAIVKSFTAIGTIILGLFCCVLVFYTNSFLIKRRKKELGLYAILGMEKGNIGVVMFFETLLVAIIALGLGLGLGMLLSKLIFWALLRLVRFPVMMDMPVSPMAALGTAAFFGLIFLLTLFSNLWQVRRASPISLLSGARQGEREPKASWLLTVVGILALAGGYFVALYYQSPLETLMLFLLAVALVIVGTFCLFTSGSIALLKLLRKNKKYYYTPGHFISVSGMIYRMKQNAAGLATICILSCMVLVTVSSTVSLNLGAEDSLRMQYPYEHQLRLDAYEDGETLLATAQSAAAENGVQLHNIEDNDLIYCTAEEKDGVFTPATNGDSMSMLVLRMLLLEDYNRNEGQAQTLAADEALLLVAGGSYSRDTLTLGGRTLRLRPLQSLGKWQAGQPDIGRTLLLVLPNAAKRDELLAGEGFKLYKERSLSFDLFGDEAGRQRFDAAFPAAFDTLHTAAPFRHTSRADGEQNWYATNGGFLFLGIYFGVLFMLAAALIIYYKQLSEGYDDAARFEILQKVGMGEAEVKKTINKQILLVFFLPLLVAVVHVAVAFFPISRAMIIFGVINLPLLAACSALTILAYALVYLVVFRQTARTYFGIVRRKS